MNSMAIYIYIYIAIYIYIYTALIVSLVLEPFFNIG